LKSEVCCRNRTRADAKYLSFMMTEIMWSIEVD
jgi:hypothetical protein